MSLCWSGGIPSLSWMRVLRCSTVSESGISISIVFPVRVFTKISWAGSFPRRFLRNNSLSTLKALLGLLS